MLLKCHHAFQRDNYKISRYIESGIIYDNDYDRGEDIKKSNISRTIGYNDTIFNIEMHRGIYNEKGRKAINKKRTKRERHRVQSNTITIRP